MCGSYEYYPTTMCIKFVVVVAVIVVKVSQLTVDQLQEQAFAGVMIVL